MYYILQRDLETPATKKIFEWCDQNYLQPFSYGMLVTTGDPSGGGVKESL